MSDNDEMEGMERDGMQPDPERRRMLGIFGGAGATAAAAAAGWLVPTAVQAQTAANASGASDAQVSTGDTSSADEGATERLAGDQTTADIVADALVAWGAEFVFGIVGDGINPVIDAIRRRQPQLRFIPVRHEESAAFMASGYAKLTGRLGVCVATTGPGAPHLLTGLYDAALDGAPVLAITGLTFHDLHDVRFIQSIDTLPIMQPLANYNVQVTGPRHATLIANLACRSALGNRGVAHLAISKDTQMMRLSEDKPSMENHGARTSSHWTNVESVPAAGQLQSAADILNGAQRVAILAGQGALKMREELLQLADILGAPVSKALLGKSLMADDSPYTVGGIGHLGTAPSEWSMHHCDAVLIVGSTMPWLDYYPKPGQAKGVQIDIRADRIGLRYPVDIGLVGDAQSTVNALLPLLHKKTDRRFLLEAQRRMQDWYRLLARIESHPGTPLKPQLVVKAVSDLLDDRAVVTLDCGANTHFAARHLRIRKNQLLTAPGMLESMAPGLPYGIAAKLAFPDRQVVTIAGDGGFAMLMAELTTAVQQKLALKIIILRNDSLAQVTFEQKEAGFPVFGCDLGPIDFVAFAQACGAVGFRCRVPAEVRAAIQAAFAVSGPALVEAIVDPHEEPLLPSKMMA